MILGASLPGMIFPAQRPAEGSNSYHYGSYATNIRKKRIYTLALFPYHYGSYATGATLTKRRGTKPSFHTTMVLTQLCSLWCRTYQKVLVSIPLWFLRNQFLLLWILIIHDFVSIPLWFLRNRRFYTTGKTIITFPYHYGSYATVVEGLRRAVSRIVSIPLWFLRNKAKEIYYGVRDCVSIPLWFLRNRHGKW